MNKIYIVNGKKVNAKSNKWAIVTLYPCLYFAVSNKILSLNQAVKIANKTFGIHISRSLSAYKTAKACYNNSKINYKYYL